MLNEATIQTIKSTVPVLEVHGTAITTRFYQLLFTNHPELLNIFNHANQKQGRQQTALANVVYAAALHIDKLESILPVVKGIAHKHRSLGVRAEHYPIVGENLLAAIKDVLGDAATDEIMGAWAEAYGVIADVFINVEAEMYRESEEQAGGWADYRAFRVVRKVRESDVITSFYLVPQDGRALALYQPGQYVSIKVNIPGDSYTHIRQYSLSDAPGQSYYRISVKREDAIGDHPAGKVSVFLHEHIEEGGELLLTAPAGDFVLDTDDARPLVLMSGGVGLTPMISMLNTVTASNPQRQVTFIHAARNGQVHALRDHVEELARLHPQLKVYWCYEQPSQADEAAAAHHHTGFIDRHWLSEVLPGVDAGFYYCGPTPFMKAIHGALLDCGVQEKDIHFEFFGPSQSLA
ncbi:NO-inducible flavohemoprotein [Paenibacillus oenotherae]|uniref:Flavohemoprotein n=1 Tax=Paenibacillus oenotherae TaxID=1435645 RepID=A0ABS7DB61_9BACL|nr:NO-inducible flavohemoprotein [Paenibacillus oenotherae]MBW7477116.1 NO-inducible flavohemoprotein [Paenibacillus oenotherae]